MLPYEYLLVCQARSHLTCHPQVDVSKPAFSNQSVTSQWLYPSFMYSLQILTSYVIIILPIIYTEMASRSLQTVLCSTTGNNFRPFLFSLLKKKKIKKSAIFKVCDISWKKIYLEMKSSRLERLWC